MNIEELRRKKELVFPLMATYLMELGWEGKNEYVYVEIPDKDILLLPSTSSEILYHLNSPDVLILPAPTIKDVRKWLKEKYGIEFSITWNYVYSVGKFYCLGTLKGIEIKISNHDRFSNINSLKEAVVTEILYELCNR